MDDRLQKIIARARAFEVAEHLGGLGPDRPWAVTVVVNVSRALEAMASVVATTTIDELDAVLDSLDDPDFKASVCRAVLVGALDLTW